MSVIPITLMLLTVSRRGRTRVGILVPGCTCQTCDMEAAVRGYFQELPCGVNYLGL